MTYALDKKQNQLQVLSLKTVERRRNALSVWKNNIQFAFQNSIINSRHKLDIISSRVDQNNPDLILKKGYTLSLVNGKRIENTKVNLIGKELVTLSEKKIIKSQITETNDRNGE